MSDEQQANIEEPEDDAVVVDDQQQLDPDQAHQDLVSQVAKKLGRDEWGDETAEPPAAEAQEETPPAEGEEEPVLSSDLQSRAEKAGLSTDLAKQLHQAGQLEETLSAFDRTLVERFQAPPEKEVQKQEPTDQKDQQEELPELDPDVYDEDIIKRDRYHKTRIDALEAQIESFIQERQDAFDGWFDETLSEMGYDTQDVEKCQRTFTAYKGLCEANGVSPEKRDRSIVERAHNAMYPDDVKKQVQKETVDRLRNAEGKFLPSSKPKGAPPQKQASAEEVHSQLVSNVATYLKKQGVEMSGY